MPKCHQNQESDVAYTEKGEGQNSISSKEKNTSTIENFFQRHFAEV